LKISKDINEILEEMKIVRRDLHKIPEIGFEEKKTSEYIQNYLDKLGVTYEKNVANTGVIAYIKGYEGKKTYCFRTDMDALSVDEDNDIDFKSLHLGNMHACGHDGHMAIALGFIKYLTQNQNKLKENIVVLFQPAEEGPGGAMPIVESGILKKYKIDEIYGLHLFPNIDEGKIGVCSGPMMSQVGEFDILIKGNSAHGAMPHEGIDSIVIASQLIAAIQTISSRSMNPMDPVVVTIGKIGGGERRNIIAREVVLEGTIRTFSDEVYKNIKNRIVAIKEGIEAAYDCEIEVVIRDLYPAVINDTKLTEEFINGQDDNVVEIITPIMLSEDFSYYQKEVPGVFFFLGSGNKEKDYVYPLHNAKFNFDEIILGYGVQVFRNILKQKGGFVD
jgi:amidohydrolase